MAHRPYGQANPKVHTHKDLQGRTLAVGDRVTSRFGFQGVVTAIQAGGNVVVNFAPEGQPSTETYLHAQLLTKLES